MKIGIEITKACENQKTGVGWYVYYLIQEMAKLDCKDGVFELYINLNKKRLNCKFLRSAPYQCKNIQVKKLAWPLRKFWTQIRLSIEMIKNPPDALFVPAHLPPLVYPKKLVVTIHDLAFKKYPAVYSVKELKLQEWGIKKVLRTAESIIVPSEFTKSEIAKYYPAFIKNNITVIPHGVDSQIFNKAKLAVKTTILYIGRLEAKKNIQHLIKAFNIIKKQELCAKYKLLLIGSAGYGYKKIKTEINLSAYKNDILELGWVGRKKIAKHLNQASVFVFPSLYEGFGLPILEAQSCGTPVVCSDIKVFKEVAGGSALYCNSKNPKDMARAIIELLQNSDLRQKFISKGLENVKKYTWTKSAIKTLEVLTK